MASARRPEACEGKTANEEPGTCEGPGLLIFDRRPGAAKCLTQGRTPKINAPRNRNAAHAITMLIDRVRPIASLPCLDALNLNPARLATSKFDAALPHSVNRNIKRTSNRVGILYFFETPANETFLPRRCGERPSRPQEWRNRDHRCCSAAGGAGDCLAESRSC